MTIITLGETEHISTCADHTRYRTVIIGGASSGFFITKNGQKQLEDDHLYQSYNTENVSKIGDIDFDTMKKIASKKASIVFDYVTKLMPNGWKSVRDFGNESTDPLKRSIKYAKQFPTVPYLKNKVTNLLVSMCEVKMHFLKWNIDEILLGKTAFVNLQKSRAGVPMGYIYKGNYYSIYWLPHPLRKGIRLDLKKSYNNMVEEFYIKLYKKHLKEAGKETVLTAYECLY